VVPELESIGLLATIDRGLLIRYCTAWADWCELTKLLQHSGKLIKGQKGNLVRNPLWMMKRDAEQAVSDMSRQLGLSPAARLRLGITHQQPKPERSPLTPTAIEEYRRALQQ
jgi:P27 family predicted phage terminase small subunit